tara:strand:- start:3 stop:104 length:102 start_codon:yes stop_codon:yes gene_type:complete
MSRKKFFISSLKQILEELKNGGASGSELEPPTP